MHDTTTVAAPELCLEVLWLKRAAALLHAINHPLRQKILRTLHQQREICVTQLYLQLKLDQSVASQHLSLLRRAGVVCTRREGRMIFYGINPERLSQLQRFAAAIL